MKAAKSKKVYKKPNEIAGEKLRKILKADYGVVDASYYKEVMMQTEQIRFMNMNILGAVIACTVKYGNQPSIDDLEEYIDGIVSKKLEEDSNPVDIKLASRRVASTMIRYLELYNNTLQEYKSSVGERAQNPETQ